MLILAHRGELLEQASDKIRKSTGLGCAMEKAEESCQGSWFRVVVAVSYTHLMSLKLNNGIGFSQKEIVSWCNQLDIPIDSIPTYFFTRKV